MTYNFITVYVKDMDKSVLFYQDVLGFTIERSFSPAPGISITFLKDDAGHEIEFIADDSKESYSGKGISIGFYVKDIYEIEKMLKSKNVHITSGPIELKSGAKLLNALDINGLEFGFFQQPK
jgi:predicted enzyme related to lactoylglutathione lyase